MAPRLPADQQNQIWAEALATARQIRDEPRRAEVMAALAPLLSAVSPSTISTMWQESLSALARRPRRELLADLRVLVAPLAAAAGEQAVAVIAQAISDVGEWWQ